MDAIVIKGTEYPLPTDFTLKKWSELNDIGFNDKLKLISVAFDVPFDEIANMPDKTQDLGASLIYALMYPSHIKPDTKNIIDFSKLTLGEFIDLDVWIVSSPVKNILNIAKGIFKTDITEETPISKVWGAYQSYYNYRKLLYTQYKGLFGGVDEDYKTSEVQQVNTQSPAHIWYELIMILADNKFLNIDNTIKRPVIEAFNYLAWHKTQIEKEKRKQREIELQRKIR